MMDVMEEKPLAPMNSCIVMKSLMKLALFTEPEVTITESHALTLLFAETATQMILALFLILITIIMSVNLDLSVEKMLWFKKSIKEDLLLAVLPSQLIWKPIPEESITILLEINQLFMTSQLSDSVLRME